MGNRLAPWNVLSNRWERCVLLARRARDDCWYSRGHAYFPVEATPIQIRTVAILSGVFWMAVAVGLIFIWSEVEDNFHWLPEIVLFLVPGMLSAIPALFGLRQLVIGLFGSDARLATVMKAGGFPNKD
jgi:hypothetical protein